MSQELIQEIEKAVESSKHWGEKGWELKFGPRQYPVNNLAEAEALKHGHAFKDEAVAYWKRAQQCGEECAEYGERAIEALKKGDMRAADDALYYAMFMEKFYEKQTRTWKPLYDKIKVAA